MERTEYPTPVSQLVNRQRWLDPVADKLAQGVQRLFDQLGDRQRLARNALHGTWLGHPLHPLLATVPLGAWTVTLVCDLLGRHRALRTTADLSLTIGLTAAPLAALAGATDWSATDGTARRVGVAHALLTSTATALYGASWAARRAEARGLGRVLALAGYAVVGLAGYLGGELVYRHRIGVDHAQDDALPADWIPVARLEALGEGELVRGEAAGVPVLLVRRGHTIHALGATCSHLGGPLAEGQVLADSVVCPWHGSRFALATGRVLEGPATYPVPCLLTRVRGGQVEVRAAPAPARQ
jgi:nitrite reductase/ring-hydroxylating ferredoxin subunit/uncharacterized membrane protein